jgi:phospholipid N-methyltransferase
MIGRDHYECTYERDLVAEDRWLSFGAVQKANSVEMLLRRNGIQVRKMIELGAGTGAVIKECRRRKLAQEYAALDYSATAIGLLKETAPGIETFTADITSSDLPIRGHFDVVIVSHVIEHLEEPKSFLDALDGLSWDHLIAEVPLENLPVETIKRPIRRTPPGMASGHVQFFNATSFDRLIESTGMTVVDRRRYVPVMSAEAVRFMSAHHGHSRGRQSLSFLTARYLPILMQPLWSFLYYAHYAVLCRR